MRLASLPSNESQGNPDDSRDHHSQNRLEYAGVSADNVGRCRDLTPERIKQQLRRLCMTGYDLGAKVNRSRDRALYDACLRHFGSWRKALSMAGVNLENVTRHRPRQLDRESMILWLRNYQAAGQSLVYSEVCLENRNHALAIRREFGSWKNAIDEALPASDYEEG